MKLAQSLLLIYLSIFTHSHPIIPQEPSPNSNPQLDNNTFHSTETIDLTENHQSFYNQYREITVQKRSSLSINYLKQLYQENPATRIKVVDTLTYIIFNRVKTEQESNQPDFIINEWDFTQMVPKQFFTVNIPLTTRLIQNKLKGTGSVGSSFTVGVSLTLAKTISKTYGIDVVIGTQWVHDHLLTNIPVLGLNPALEFTKSETETFKLSDSISVSATCTSENGHSVSQYIRVGLTRFEAIKIRQITFNEREQKWYLSDWTSLEGDFNPTISVACVTEEQPINSEYEINI